MSDASGPNGRRSSPLTAELRQMLFRAAFNMPQLKIVQCLAEVTIRRNLAGVRLSHDELAGLCGLAASGHFREAFDELLAHGVVRRLAAKHGRRAAAYALNPDFVNGWGKFSDSPAKLTAIFSGLDWTDDCGVSLPAGRQTTNAARLPAEGQIKPPRAEDDTRVGGFDLALSQREILTPNSEPPVPATLARARAREEAPEQPPDLAKAYGLRLSVTVNKGLAEHATRPQPVARVMAAAGSTREAAESIVALGIPLDFAERAAFSLATTHNADGEVRTLKYFVPGIVRLWEQHQASIAAALSDAPQPISTAEPALTATSNPSRPGIGGRAYHTALRAAQALGHRENL